MSGISNDVADGTQDPARESQGLPPSHLQTLVEVVRWRANSHPERTAFTFLRDGERDEVHLTYAQLDRKAARLAGQLTHMGAEGQPVLLVFDPGIEYVVGFFACLYAGAIAVPVYPPDPFRLPRTLPRLQAIVENAGADLLLTTSEMARQSHLEQISANLLLVDEPYGDAEVRFDTSADGLALLQYTSGSTGTPRGVIVNHGNLMHNFRAMHSMFDVDNAVVAHWLPPYHDMGLIGCLLLPIYSGRQTVAMSPLAFMQKPVRWLQALDRFRATTSGAPNFGYELCVRKIKREQIQGLDLSHWKVAVTGAEPVRSGTLEAFCEKFAPAGFCPETFLPAFGMAEATLIVSGEHRTKRPRMERVDLADLESNTISAASDERPSRTLVGCGRPAQDVTLAIVEPESRCQMGENQIGEIWLQSPGVGAGYWGDPRRTQEMFRATLANDSPDKRFLRTGDMGFLRDGELFITGRRKELIILAGRNLYPLDLEQAVQAAHPDLKTDGGAAFSIEVDGEERLVVVQEILRPKKNDLHQVLRLAGQALMTEAGVAPHALVLIAGGSLPKTSSGKTRRGECRRLYLEGGLRVLAQWPLVESEPARDSTPPVTEMERGLAPIWEEVLGVENIGLEDDFFLLGAKSLRVAAMLGRASEWLNVDVPLSTLFNHSTLHAFAQALERLVAERDGTDGAGRMELSEGASEAPLTDAQLRFWFLERLSRAGHQATNEASLEPLDVDANANASSNAIGAVADLVPTEEFSGHSLHIPIRLTLTGSLNVAALKQRLREIMARHDMLRARFVDGDDGIPLQQIAHQVDMPWREGDFRESSSDYDATGFERWHCQLETEPMNLHQAPLARVGLAQLSDEKWQLTIVLHHLIADGWSAGLLLRELGESDLSAPRAPAYSAFAAWQASTPPVEGKQAYWQKRLDGAPTSLPLEATDAGAAQLAARNGLCQCEFDTRLLADVQQLARDYGATPFMVHMAVFQIVLSRYTQTSDLLVGTVSANRRRPVLETIVGCFINTIPIRGDLSGDPTFSDFMKATRERVIADLEHADYSFERLLQDVRPQREVGRLPLVQALLLLQDMPQFPPRVAGAEVVAADAGQAGLAEFDVALSLEPRVDGLAAKLNFRRDRLESDAAERMLETYAAVLEAVITHPKSRLSDLPIPAKAERLELLVERNATHRRIEQPCPVAMLEQPLPHCREKIAIRFEPTTSETVEVSYDELHQQANQVAHWLQQRGVGPDVPVGIMMRRSPQMIAAMLAVLKAGGAYVPLDPIHPSVRLQAIWKDCQPLLVITDDSDASDSDGSSDSSDRCGDVSHSDLFGDAASHSNVYGWEELRRESNAEPATCPPINATGDHLSYIMYTSGTTGEPKGVMVTRKGVANFLQCFARTPGMTAEDRVLAHTTMSFDISVLELLLPLAVGAEIVLAPCGAGRDPRRLIELIERHRVSFLQATPSGFRMLRSAGWRPTSNQRLLAGGESLSTDLANELLESGAALWNVYGPTETTIWSTIQRMTPLASFQTPSIGRPIDNTEVYVLDDAGRPVPAGVCGELCIGGVGVARGYWRREAMTRERFVADDFTEPGRTMYRTGDRVRWRADGQLEFRGRTDAQVKLRGHRVELGEVEAALLSHPVVSDAAVICHRQGEDASLAAYIVLNDSATADGVVDALRDHVANQTPNYMIPSTFIEVESLPKSVAGKVDRQALTALAVAPVRPDVEHIAPRTPLESEVAEIWAEVLARSDIGVLDDFFQLGGHSLKATRMLSRVESRHNVQLDMAAFFERPTIEAMAQQVRLAMAQQADNLDEMLKAIEALSDEEAKQSKSSLE